MPAWMNVWFSADRSRVRCRVGGRSDDVLAMDLSNADDAGGLPALARNRSRLFRARFRVGLFRGVPFVLAVSLRRRYFPAKSPSKVWESGHPKSETRRCVAIFVSVLPFLRQHFLGNAVSLRCLRSRCVLPGGRCWSARRVTHGGGGSSAEMRSRETFLLTRGPVEPLASCLGVLTSLSFCREGFILRTRAAERNRSERTRSSVPRFPLKFISFLRGPRANADEQIGLVEFPFGPRPSQD